MKQLGLFLIPFLFLIQLQAAPLPAEHFLAPRDYEVMWLSGIESPISASGVRRAATKCQEGPVFSNPPFEVCPWIEEIAKASIQKLNLKQIVSDTDQVVFFGERHLNIDVQEMIANLITILPPGRIQALALEMINAEDQTTIDSYLRNEINLEEMKSVFEKGWNYESSGYMKILEAAKKKKLAILALDDRPRFKGYSFSDNLLGRDVQMSSVLNDYLNKNPEHRLIVYSGKLHAFRSLGIDQSANTIADNIKREHPLLQTSHYLIFGKRESPLLRESLKALKLPSENIFLKSKALAPYIDGTIFLN